MFNLFLLCEYYPVEMSYSVGTLMYLPRYRLHGPAISLVVIVVEIHLPAPHEGHSGFPSAIDNVG